MKYIIILLLTANFVSADLLDEKEKAFLLKVHADERSAVGELFKDELLIHSKPRLDKNGRVVAMKFIKCYNGLKDGHLKSSYKHIKHFKKLESLHLNSGVPYKFSQKGVDGLRQKLPHVTITVTHSIWSKKVKVVK